MELTEVRKMLEYYGFTSQYDAIKEWYDGYLFGNVGIYCPWDVINYCGDLRDGSVTEPQNYWVNTSSNDIVRRFLGRANSTTRNEIEQLIDGKSVRKKIHQELTELVIPNREVQWIFVQQIRAWFRDRTVQNTDRLEQFCRAFEENDAAAVESKFNEYLDDMISIRDTSVRKTMKENFYHGLLLGILANRDDWVVESNAECGDGYSDISVEIRKKEIGIACYRKRCRVVSECCTSSAIR